MKRALFLVVALLLVAGSARGQCKERGWALGVVSNDSTFVIAWADLGQWRMKSAIILLGSDSTQFTVDVGRDPFMERSLTPRPTRLYIRRQTVSPGFLPHWSLVEEYDLKRHRLHCAYYSPETETGRWVFANLTRYENRGSRFKINYPERGQ